MGLAHRWRGRWPHAIARCMHGCPLMLKPADKYGACAPRGFVNTTSPTTNAVNACMLISVAAERGFEVGVSPPPPAVRCCSTQLEPAHRIAACCHGYVQHHCYHIGNSFSHVNWRLRVISSNPGFRPVSAPNTSTCAHRLVAGSRLHQIPSVSCYDLIAAGLRMRWRQLERLPVVVLTCARPLPARVAQPDQARYHPQLQLRIVSNNWMDPLTIMWPVTQAHPPPVGQALAPAAGRAKQGS